MAYPFYSLEYSGTLLDTNLNNVAFNIDTRDGLKTRVGTANFQVQNIDNDYIIAETGTKFKIDDSVDIYMGYSGSAQIFSGFVNSISEQCDLKQRNIKVSCVNKMERLLSTLDAKAYGVAGPNLTASNILKDIITRVNGKKKPGSSEPDITVNNVTTTNLDITPYGYNYRPVMEILREFSTPEKTGAGQFIYYIDKSNDLHFKPRPGIGGTTPTINEYNFTEFRATYEVFDIANYIVVNCGTDDNGNTIIALGTNWNSITTVGFRYKYVLKTEIGDGLKGQGLSVSDQRNAMRAQGESWGNYIALLLGEPRWKIDCTMKGNYNYPGSSVQMITGEVVKVTSPSNWSGTKVLRVMDIRQSFTSRGWMTELQLEEDDKTKVEPI